MDYKKIQQPVNHLLKKTDSIIKKSINSKVRLLQTVSQSTPITRGKKIRSTLLFLLAGMNNKLKEDLPEIAASIELLHISSLIHDDIVDNSKLRRGEKTVNQNFGNHLSVLWGDFLFVSSLQILNKNKYLPIKKVIINTAKQMIEGQIIEYNNIFNYQIQMPTYLNIIEKKTGALFAGISEISGLINGGDDHLSRKLHNFGLNFGKIFQISDDLLDIFSDNSGKDRFSDLKEGKITLPYIILLKKCSPKTISNLSKNDPGDLLKLCERYSVKNLSMETINGYYEECKAFIRDFPESPFKKSLAQLIDFVKYRDF